MMIQRLPLALGVLLAIMAGCTIDVPNLPLDGLDSFADRLENAFDNLVEDPLDTNPYPVLVGGDSSKTFYATSLTDVKLNFQRPTNDVVLASFVGPSNLYVREDKQRELIQALIPTGAYYGMSTDGTWLAYAQFDGTTDDPSYQVIARDIDYGDAYVVFDSATEALELDWPQGRLPMSDGRLAVLLMSEDWTTSQLRVVDLEAGEVEFEIVDQYMASPDLRGNYLAYALERDGEWQVVLKSLSNGETTVVANEVRSEWGPTVMLTENAVVWSEDSDDTARIYRYDIPSGETRVWREDAQGTLAGANDNYFVTELYTYNDVTNVERISVYRYDASGNEKRLANFRADGLAGQTCILGDNAAWVNPDRDVILAPLAGGSRAQFRPF